MDSFADFIMAAPSDSDRDDDLSHAGQVVKDSSALKAEHPKTSRRIKSAASTLSFEEEAAQLCALTAKRWQTPQRSSCVKAEMSDSFIDAARASFLRPPHSAGGFSATGSA